MADKPNKQLETRPPIVVIIGHVDHGKTKILDYIRKTKVAEKESGSITQHIGAYQVVHKSKIITFLDTPGHEAFSAIRSRGCHVADIAILVIAADEAVKPQTKEAIRFIKESKIPFIVAINKIDKENANPQKIKQELAENEVFVEGWGGNITAVEVSAKTGQGIDELLDLLLLSAELEELKTQTNTAAKGVVIESHMDNKRGCVATLLVMRGVLSVSDHLVAGTSEARVKLMEDFNGKEINKALPSQPVLTLGWNHAPDLGEEFEAVSAQKDAQRKIGEAKQKKPAENLFIREPQNASSSKKLLDIVIKADVFSSLEAIDQAIGPIQHEEVAYHVISYGVGNVTEQDIQTALLNKGVIYGFHVSTESSASGLAKKEGVQIKTFSIIYELVETLRKDLSQLLDPEIQKNKAGKIRVLATFKKDAKMQVVGGKVIEGTVKRGLMVDVLHEKELVATGKLSQLQHNKEDVEEVKEGLECGVRFQGDPIIQKGDILEVYEEKRVIREV